MRLCLGWLEREGVLLLVLLLLLASVSHSAA